MRPLLQSVSDIDPMTLLLRLNSSSTHSTQSTPESSTSTLQITPSRPRHSIRSISELLSIREEQEES
uniref:Uncharacterized protein n=1 Tax=Caenorhabditis japonica TaxID=281687 RepID=A0A8R1I5C5_CAEJA